MNEFLGEFNRVLSTKLECTNKNAAENKKKFDDLSKQLEILEKTRKEVNSVKVNRLVCSFN